MTRFSLKICGFIPSQYPNQRGLSCGEFNVIGLLDAFQIPYEPCQNLTFRVKLFGYSFIEDLSGLLERHSLSAPVKYADHLTEQEQLELLCSHIDQDNPILMAIGNGHLSRERYSPLARRFIGHFITVYGYDHEKEIFYIYDPYLKGDHHDDLPGGNEIRTFKELLLAWEGPIYYPAINMDHVYIPVSLK